MLLKDDVEGFVFSINAVLYIKYIMELLDKTSLVNYQEIMLERIIFGYLVLDKLLCLSMICPYIKFF